MDQENGMMDLGNLSTAFVRNSLAARNRQALPKKHFLISNRWFTSLKMDDSIPGSILQKLIHKDLEDRNLLFD